MSFILRVLTVSLVLFGCTAQEPRDWQYSEHIGTKSEGEKPQDGIVAVEVADNDSDGYTFSATIKSQDEGCDQYANWWEVVTEEGDLLYRRILAHSHVDEQPFTRSGGPVNVESDQVVIVRSHMHPTGYHTQAMKGSFSTGFESTVLPADFASQLTSVQPLPAGCTF